MRHLALKAGLVPAPYAARPDREGHTVTAPTSVPFKTTGPARPTVTPMTPHFDLIGLAVTDMARTLDFYRRLGVPVPPGAEHEPHVEVTLAGGIRLAWDSVDTLRSFDPDLRHPPAVPGRTWRSGAPTPPRSTGGTRS